MSGNPFVELDFAVYWFTLLIIRTSFVICNEGYTIERYIHGWDAAYNDIQSWKFNDLVPAFGARPDQYKTHQVRTKQQLLGLLKDKDFSDAKTLQVSFRFCPM